MSEATTDRPKKLEIGGLPLVVAGVTIRLVRLERQAASVEVSVDAQPRFVKPSEAALNRPT